MSLRNPRILSHPCTADEVLAGDQLLELELESDLFAPGAESWGRLRLHDNPNLSSNTRRMLENFLALAEIANELTKLPDDRRQLHNVRLYYLCVLSPETAAKMKSEGKTPSQLIDKSYSSHILRIHVSSRETTPSRDTEIPRKITDPWGHTFGNIQRALNSQTARMKMKEEKKENTKKRKRDGDEEQPQETMEQMWRRVQHFGVWELKQVPVFQNPVVRGRNPPTQPLYSYVHNPSESQYCQIVESYMRIKVAEDRGRVDINDPHSPYNPINVWSPMINFWKRSKKLFSHEVYSHRKWESKDPKKKEKLKNLLQDEIRFDRCVETDGHTLVVPYGDNQSEARQEGITRWTSWYEGELCWKMDVEDFNPKTFMDRLFPWASKTVDSTAVSREQRAYIRGAPDVEGLPTLLLEIAGEGIHHPRQLMTWGQNEVMGQVITDHEQLRIQYNHTVNMQPTAGLGSMTIRRWGEENMARKARAEAYIANTPHYHGWRQNPELGSKFLNFRRETRVRVALDCIAEYKAKVFTPEITASKACRSIAKHFHDGASRAEQEGRPFLMSFPREYKFHNLSHLGDALAQDMEGLDSLFLMAQGHDRVLIKLMSALQVHIPFWTADKNAPRSAPIHTSFLTQSSKGGVGKSFQDAVFAMMLIVGSYMSCDLLTPQFITGSDAPPDDENFVQMFDRMIFIMDELMNGLIEAAEGAGGSGQSQGSSSIAEMFKTVITKGLYQWMGPLLDKVNNSSWRANGEIKVRCECMFSFSTNKSLMHYSHAALSRLLVEHARGFVERVGLYGSITAKMAAESNLSLNQMKQKGVMIERSQRNQVTSMVVGQLNQGAVDGFTIDLSCANHIYNWVKDIAPDYHLTGWASRNFDQYRALVQGFILYDMNHKMFDIPGAPFASRPWTFADAMWFRPHLVSTTEHATLAFGAMRSCFENEGLMLTTRLLYHWVDQLRRTDAERARKPPGDEVIAYRWPKNKEPQTYDEVILEKEEQSDGTWFFSVRIDNPSAFTFAGGHTKNQLAKQLAHKLLALKSQFTWAFQLTEDLLVNSVRLLVDTNVDVPYWVVGDHGLDRMDAHRTGVEQLRLEPNRITIAATTFVEVAIVKQRVQGRDMEEFQWAVDLQRVDATEASLKAALKRVLEHAFCATKRDFVYGAPRTGRPDLLDVLSVQPQDPTTNPLELKVINSMQEEEYLTEDIDDYFIRQFNTKMDFGTYILRAYPSNHPTTLMQQLFMLQPPIIRPPYPTHDALFFPEEYHRRRNWQLDRMANRKRLQLNDCPQGRLAQVQEKGLELEIFQRARRQGVNDCPAPPRQLMSSEWMQHDRSKPIHPLLVTLSNPRPWKPKKKSPPPEWPLPSHLQHPWTTMQLEDSHDRTEQFLSLYSDSVKTLSDVVVHEKESCLDIVGHGRFRIYNQQLDPYDDPPPPQIEEIY